MHAIIRPQVDGADGRVRFDVEQDGTRFGRDAPQLGVEGRKARGEQARGPAVRQEGCHQQDVAARLAESRDG